MKLETLNIWGGKIFEPLLEHLKKQASIVDIFCFQEVYHTTAEDEKVMRLQEQKNAKVFFNTMPSRVDIYRSIQEKLIDFTSYFSYAQEFHEFGHKVYYGLAIFVKKGITVQKEGEVFVYRGKNTWVENNHASLGRNVQYIQFELNGKPCIIANLHGLWTGGGKEDTLERVEQSKKVKAFLDDFKGAKILCGDFNLLPQTESIKILEEGMKNLVKEYAVSSTRSHLYEKPNKFADYILTSLDVKVKDFQVLQDVVSDHLPLVLDFEI